MKANKVSYEFLRYGDDRCVKLGFQIHRDMPWTEILPFFLDFLKANGYVFNENHELFEMCTYDHAIE